MLNNEDRRAIEGLFRRLEDVERRGEPRDAEAAALIRELIARQPAAPYYMAQTILVQEHALEIAERRIRELEEQVEQGRRGSIGGLLGSGRTTPRRGPWDRQDQPWDRLDPHADDRRGGGFLAGAAQTALGVAGGVLIGHAIASMFGGGQAHAAEAPADQPPVEPSPADEPGADPGDADAGGDFGDSDFGGGFGGDGFDFGGDF